MIGIADQTKLSSYLGSGSQDYAYFGDNGKYVKGASGATYGNSFGNGDIVGVALDLDNNKLYFSKNGTLAKFRSSNKWLNRNRSNFY